MSKTLLLRSVGFLAFLCWGAIIGSLVFISKVYTSAPRKPDAEHLVHMVSHGTDFYVTAQQSYLFHGLLFGGFLLFFVMCALGLWLRYFRSNA